MAEDLDVGEDVIPAATVQADDVIAQAVHNLMELEGGEQVFDEDGASVQ